MDLALRSLRDKRHSHASSAHSWLDRSDGGPGVASRAGAAVPRRPADGAGKPWADSAEGLAVTTRQQRRSQERADAKRETRRQQFDRIHGQVLAGRTVYDLWRTYAAAKLTPHGIDIDDPAVEGTLRLAFYAGAASMMELMQRVGPDEITEDQGVEMLQRLHEELETYTRGRAAS